MKSTTLSSNVCITEMVQHIYDESKAYFEDRGIEDWWFYHDALSLMTAKDTIEWMKTKGIYDRWILPVLGLNSEKDLARYSKAPVGNSPELMPLDCSLNKDLIDALNWHLVVTAHLPEDDPLKFSISTPKRGDHAIKRVLAAGNPSPKRVVQDINKVVDALFIIMEYYNGAVVPGLGDRKGKRREMASSALETDPTPRAHKGRG